MSDIELVDNSNTSDIGDNEGAMVPAEMNDTDFGEAGSDEAPFLAVIADIISSVAPGVDHATMSSYCG